MSTPYELHGDVAVITLNNPPVNGLSHALRSRIVAGIDAAARDAKAKAIVLIGTEGAFSGGADIKEFNTPAAFAEPSLHTVNSAVESSTKPVIAAISGAALGGGLELALSAHYRVALSTASVGLPEVKLGILPGAGGTQRLPRVVGVETALNLIVSGEPVPAAKLASTQLFDQVVEGNLIESALAFAKKVVAEKLPLKKVRDIKISYPEADGYFQFARNTVGALSKNFPAPLKCVDAVAAAVSKPFEEGLKVEAKLFAELVQTDESKALRHAFFGERAASKIADVPSDTKLRDIKSVGIIGAGTMGGGIAMNFLNAGIPVKLIEQKQEALDKGVAIIKKNYEGSLKKGKLTQDQLDTRLGQLSTSLDYASLKDADLIIEAVFESMEVKKSVFTKLDEVAKPGAILATNTSTLDVDQIAAFTKRPQDVLGLHFFSPANVMRLLEVVRGAKTAKDVLATTMAIAKKIKKTAVVSGVCDGFIGNRMLHVYMHQGDLLVEEGATPWQVDKVIEKFGFAMGPFRVADLAGNDIGYAIRKERYAKNPALKQPNVGDRIAELGRFGQKTGSGYYKYEAGRRDAIPDPVVDGIVAEVRAEKGITPRKISDQEILERSIYALVNEGARILQEGIAQRASDIDMVYLSGYGFPIHRGGPMLYADSVGLYSVLRAIEKYHAQTGDKFWEPAELIKKLVAEGKSFNG
ncbi:MAG TPA: 3-hydroxyacyl-CoA dehydrogenase NAD-binding domain-containing protein [Polyangiales bacterium]|nr:3-hydroxyacyl-CoA dehydrogenase NAD-binding domain-containing protein [Polyangiales bacterium]